MGDDGDGAAMPLLGTAREHARHLFRGGIVAGFAGFALYIAFDEAAEAQGGALLAVRTVALLISFAGGALSLVGALLIPRMVIHAPREPDESPSESFLRLAERAEAWIARARRYIVLGGIFGGVVWVPLMFIGLFMGPRGNGAFEIRLLAIGGSLAFAAVAVLWWRRVVEIDRELRAWRTQLQRLRSIEADILAEP